MKKGDLKRKHGFTIIEVSLVIAIAGLIFLMAFVALPQLQRSRRDAQRREDVSMFLESVKKYQTNNRGSLPVAEFLGGSYGVGAGSSNFSGSTNMDSASDTSWMGFYKNYLGDSFIDPSGEKYGVLVLQCNGSVGASCQPTVDSRQYNEIWSYLYDNRYVDRFEYRMFVFLEATCNGEQPVRTSNPRKIAVVYKLEGSGTYCSNS